MNQLTTPTAPQAGAGNSGKHGTTEGSTEASSVRYHGPTEPRVSAWAVVGVVAVLLALAYLVFKFAHG